MTDCPCSPIYRLSPSTPSEASLSALFLLLPALGPPIAGLASHLISHLKVAVETLVEVIVGDTFLTLSWVSVRTPAIVFDRQSVAEALWRSVRAAVIVFDAFATLLAGVSEFLVPPVDAMIVPVLYPATARRLDATGAFDLGIPVGHDGRDFRIGMA